MSEERSQGPSKRRRELAKEKGIVARSPELTAAVGWSATLALAGFFGPKLWSALVSGLRTSTSLIEAGPIGAAELVARLRAIAWEIGGPLSAIGGGTFAAMILAHQIQVGGLWKPKLLAPDLARLVRADVAIGSRLARGGWSLAKAALIAAVAAWSLRSSWPEAAREASIDVSGLTRAGAKLSRAVFLPAVASSLALGIVDFLAQIARIERALGMSADEVREESRAIDGDPNARSRRRLVAESWRDESTNPLAGASLVVSGSFGLTLVLAGDRPPGKIEVKAIARGASGAALRRAADRAGVARVDAPALALYLCARRVAGAALPADLAAELARIWPNDRNKKE